MAWETAWWIRRASSSPEITWMGMPSCSAASTKAWAFFASRRAAVPQAMTVSQPKSRITFAIWPRASSPAWKASGPISPERA